jgi:Cytochrome c
MKPAIAFCMASAVAAAVFGGNSWVPAAQDNASPARNGHDTKTSTSRAPIGEQVPTWSKPDMDFFLHGSMGTEVVPEVVLRAFIKTYPDLFPTQDLTHLGLIPDPKFGWPIGFSRTNVKHLGGLAAVGINCASCHVAQITSTSSQEPIQILGVTSHFNVEAFFGSVLVATFKTSDPANMKKFLVEYLGDATPVRYDEEWREEQTEILEMMKSDPFGSNGVAPGELHAIKPEDVRLHPDAAHGSLATLAYSMLKLFHNMRAALHVPDKPPEKVPPASGPGRNDAFGLLSASLLNAPQPYSSIKFGLVWNVDQRTWVHWDGNTRSPIARNLLASLGLGAPMHGKQGDLDFAMVKRQTDLSEKIRPPRYPFAIDEAAAKRGAPLFEANCNTCHGGPEDDRRLHSVAEVGTDPHRAEMFTQKLADGFNKFLAELEAEGYQPPKEFGVRSTGKYFAATLKGVWARSPYLHNGSVRTMQQLLTTPADRAKTFHRGSRVYDERNLGYTDEGVYVLDTAASGNSNSGHDYGTNLSSDEKRDLIEYLKTL